VGSSPTHPTNIEHIKMQPKYHPKGWGYELWIHNDEKYCGKMLYFNKGMKCSYHYHKKKHETFYLQSGKLLLRYGMDDDLESAVQILLTPGDVFEVLPYLRHQMEALEDSELMEFSTEHFESDSYRVEKGD
jgi:quercetin dioxygenase-like cupin family protein